MVKRVNLYFHVHQPFRLARYSPFEQSEPGSAYFDEAMNRKYFESIARSCYLPANAMLLELLEAHDHFAVSFSVSGTLISQASAWCPEVLEGFRAMARTGRAEFLAETYYHSLSSLFFSHTEFRKQVRKHADAVRRELGFKPRVFRNTELLYDNRTARAVRSLGFKAMLCEGTERLLGGRSPNYNYLASDAGGLKLLLRNYHLSDDVGFRFSNQGWGEWPLVAPKYAAWLDAADGDFVNLFMDYETIGEHHWRSTGIFEFIRHLPSEAEARGVAFGTLSQAAEFTPSGEVGSTQTVSWADLERDASAWLGNRQQWSCFHKLQQVASKVAECGDEELLETCRKLQTSDHFMYLCRKSWSDGDVHKHFSPYKENSPFENYANFMNILIDFEKVVDDKLGQSGTSSGEVAFA